MCRRRTEEFGQGVNVLSDLGSAPPKSVPQSVGFEDKHKSVFGVEPPLDSPRVPEVEARRAFYLLCEVVEEPDRLGNGRLAEGAERDVGALAPPGVALAAGERLHLGPGVEGLDQGSDPGFDPGCTGIHGGWADSSVRDSAEAVSRDIGSPVNFGVNLGDRGLDVDLSAGGDRGALGYREL